MSNMERWIIVCLFLALPFPNSGSEFQERPTILLEAHCDNAIRIRIAPSGPTVLKNAVGALNEVCGESTSVRSQVSGYGSLVHGNLKVNVSSDGIQFSRVSDGAFLLTSALPIFLAAQCDADYSSFAMNFSTPTGDRIYGLGQLEAETQSDCNDSPNPQGSCSVAMNRRNAPQPIAISSVKYHIAVPFAYSTFGFGMFFNLPGVGSVSLSSQQTSVSFACQKQLDLWVVAPPTSPSQPNNAAAVYDTFGMATGRPAPLPSFAMGYWQSKNRYYDSAEVLQLAKNFSDLGLQVGVIVIDLGIAEAPPYYRLDPARFPDIKNLSDAVFNLTGAKLMPNLKPTSVAKQDCPMCGGVSTKDGTADDGHVDPSALNCSACVWTKRVKPFLFDQGIETYWLDDDEGNKFTDASFACGPVQYCGMAVAGKLWSQLFADGTVQGSAPPLVLSRNMWAGGAATGTALWSSDIVCSWKELRAQVGVGLSSGLSGWPYWTSDVGGFFGETTPELVARWHQFGSVCPLYRSHGSREFNEPWSFGNDTFASIRKSIQLRTDLKEYIKELVSNASLMSQPVMRPIWWHFDLSDDVVATQEEIVFMFGPKYLAAPVLYSGQRNQTVYLPSTEGGWTHYYTKQTYEGGKSYTVDAPYDELPLFERAI